MELFHKSSAQPVWLSFENPTGGKGCGGKENNGAKGHSFEYFEQGETKTICDMEGPAILRRIWITIDERGPEVLQGLRLKIFWDHCETPAVDVPFGDFFCMGLGHMKTFENALFSSPEGRSFNCYVPMPFKHHAKITLTNDSCTDIKRFFFDINLTREPVEENALYFHTAYRHLPLTTLTKDVEILPKVCGTGRYLGAQISVKTNPIYEDSWWGEGEVKVYLDGDTDYPSLVGTGTEDYIGSGWSQGEFANLYQGCLHCRGDEASFYRFHIPDPIYFQTDCKVTIQNIGDNLKPHVLHYYRDNNAPLIVTSAEVEGRLTQLYGKDVDIESLPDNAYLDYYRQDSYTTVGYYYLDKP